MMMIFRCSLHRAALPFIIVNLIIIQQQGSDNKTPASVAVAEAAVAVAYVGAASAPAGPNVAKRTERAQRSRENEWPSPTKSSGINELRAASATLEEPLFRPADEREEDESSTAQKQRQQQQRQRRAEPSEPSEMVTNPATGLLASTNSTELALRLAQQDSSATESNATSNSDNGGASEAVPPYMQHMTIILVVLHLSVFITGLVGNSLVCLSVYRNKSLQTVTNYYIVNLAVADFLVILICLPPTVYWDLTLTWNFGLVLCKLVLYLQSISVSVSVLTLTCISIDRWYAICKPLQFSSTKYRAKITIGLIWLVSMLIASPDVIFLTTRPLHEENNYIYMDCTYSWPESSTKVYQLCIVTLLFVGPFVLMSISYSHIVNVLWRNDTTLDSMQHSMQLEEEQQFLRRKNESISMTTAVATIHWPSITTATTVAPDRSGSNNNINGSKEANEKQESCYEAEGKQAKESHGLKLQLKQSKQQRQLCQRKDSSNNKGYSSGGSSNGSGISSNNDNYNNDQVRDEEHQQLRYANRIAASTTTTTTAAEQPATRPAWQPSRKNSPVQLASANSKGKGNENTFFAGRATEAAFNSRAQRQQPQQQKQKELQTKMTSNSVSIAAHQWPSRAKQKQHGGNNEDCERATVTLDTESAATTTILADTLVNSQSTPSNDNEDFSGQAMGEREAARRRSLSLSLLSSAGQRDSSITKAGPKVTSYAAAAEEEEKKEAATSGAERRHTIEIYDSGVEQHGFVPTGSWATKSRWPMLASHRDDDDYCWPAKTAGALAKAKRAAQTGGAAVMIAGCLKGLGPVGEQKHGRRLWVRRQTAAATLAGDLIVCAPNNGKPSGHDGRSLVAADRKELASRLSGTANGLFLSEGTAAATATAASVSIAIESLGSRTSHSDELKLANISPKPPPAVTVVASAPPDGNDHDQHSSSASKARLADEAGCKPSKEAQATVIVVVDGVELNRSDTGIISKDILSSRANSARDCLLQIASACDGDGLSSSELASIADNLSSYVTSTIADTKQLGSSGTGAAAVAVVDELGPLKPDNSVRLHSSGAICDPTTGNSLNGPKVSSESHLFRCCPRRFGSKRDNNSSGGGGDRQSRKKAQQRCGHWKFGNSASKITNYSPVTTATAAATTSVAPRLSAGCTAAFGGANRGSVSTSTVGSGGGLHCHWRHQGHQQVRRLLTLASGAGHTFTSMTTPAATTSTQTLNSRSKGKSKSARIATGGHKSKKSSALRRWAQTSLGELNAASNGAANLAGASYTKAANANHSVHHHGTLRSQTRFCKLIESRKKAAKMLIVIVIMFGLCYLPIHFLNILRYTIGLPQNNITTIASLVSHWLCYFNSAVNPLIYNLMSGKFRHEFANLFFCKCFRRR